MNLIHKSVSDDVLICNPVLMLPQYVPIEQDNITILDHDMAVLPKKYFMDNERGMLVRKDSLSWQISEEQFNNYDKCSYFHIKDFYEKDSMHGGYVLKNPWVPMNLQSYFRTDECVKNSYQESLDTINALSQINKEFVNYFEYTRVINNIDNYYFYNKEHEHVPGTMLIEVARQAMYHQFYKYDGWERGSVSVSMNELHCDFMSYVESFYPLYTLTYNTNLSHQGKSKSTDKTVVFFQNAAVVGSVRLKGAVISMKLFERLRNLKVEDSAFFSLAKKYGCACFISDGDSFFDEIKLVKFSQKKIYITSARNMQEGKHYHILIEFKKESLIIPVCVVKQMDNDLIELSIGELNKDKNKKLMKFIKTRCVPFESIS